MRLTFVGDIACDKPLLKAAKDKNGAYDFLRVFQTGAMFEQSDYVIGNLEVCFAPGPRYAYKPYHYSVPDAFCKAIADAGINVLGMANNHCFDENTSGIKRSIGIVESAGIQHTGTFAQLPADNKRYIILEKDGIKVAVYSLTDTVNPNYEASSCDDVSRYVNIIGFHGQLCSRNAAINYLKFSIKPRLGKLYRRLRYGSTIGARVDRICPYSVNDRWWEAVKEQIGMAQSEADITVVMLHIGGQFNKEPGEFSRKIVKELCDMGVDIIAGHHPHTIQKLETVGKTVVAYSLGGFCMSPSGEYIVHECLPEYSMVLHVDIDDQCALHTSWELTKGIEDADAYLSVYPVEVLRKTKHEHYSEQDIECLTRRIEGK